MSVSVSAGSEGVHSQPFEHCPPKPLLITCQPHRLLYPAGLPAGQQLQPLTVSGPLQEDCRTVRYSAATILLILVY